MKLTTFTQEGSTRVGVITDDGVVDLAGIEPRLPATLRGLLVAGDSVWPDVRRAVLRSKSRLPLARVRLEAPIADPQKFLGLGFSYRSHVAEMRERRKDLEIPSTQVWFNKQVSCIVGPYDAIHKPRVSDLVDYEAELAVVIGRRCRHVRAKDAGGVIAGYMICNDVTVHDWQRRSPTATLGKSFDTHGPTGPWLTLSEGVPNPGALRLRTWVDGELRQDGNTNDFRFSIGEMIEELTTAFTLEPGDILTTGTPPGLAGSFSPPRYLQVGQTVRIEIEGLGQIENIVVDEPAP